MTLLTSLTNEELIQGMRSGDMTAVEIELVNRLEAAGNVGPEAHLIRAFTTLLREVLDAEAPQSHSQALGCGLEDRGITDRYQAAEYGFEKGAEAALEEVGNLIDAALGSMGIAVEEDEG